MKKRLANKILKAKYDYLEHRRCDFPYTSQQLYVATKRADLHMVFGYPVPFPRKMFTVNIVDGEWHWKEIFI